LPLRQVACRPRYGLARADTEKVGGRQRSLDVRWRPPGTPAGITPSSLHKQQPSATGSTTAQARETWATPLPNRNQAACESTRSASSSGTSTSVRRSSMMSRRSARWRRRPGSALRPAARPGRARGGPPLLVAVAAVVPSGPPPGAPLRLDAGSPAATGAALGVPLRLPLHLPDGLDGRGQLHGAGERERGPCQFGAEPGVKPATPHAAIPKRPAPLSGEPAGATIGRSHGRLRDQDSNEDNVTAEAIVTAPVRAVVGVASLAGPA
jgi:hypothetical protein